MNTKRHRDRFNGLREWREAHGYSQRDAAALLGVSQPGYCKWEAGITHPRRHLARAVARKTGVAILRLLGVAA